MIINRPEYQWVYVFPDDFYAPFAYKGRVLSQEEYLEHWGKWVVADSEERLAELAVRLNSYVEVRQIHSIKYCRVPQLWAGRDKPIMGIFCDDREREEVKNILSHVGVSPEIWMYDREVDEKWQPGGEWMGKWIASQGLAEEEAEKVEGESLKVRDEWQELMFGTSKKAEERREKGFWSLEHTAWKEWSTTAEKPKDLSYSEYWRVNKSHIEHIELANALTALRKVAGHMRVSTEVVWAGMPCDIKQKIELPAVLALGEYPIPTKKMDRLVGFTIHQAFHVLEESESVLDHLSQMFPKTKDEIVLRRLAEAGEDIHVDGVAIKRGVPGKYVRKSRSWWSEYNGIDFTAGPPTPEGLYGVWTNIVLDMILPNIPPENWGTIPETLGKFDSFDLLSEAICSGDKWAKLALYGTFLAMPPGYLKPLELLLPQTKELVEADPERRALCYSSLWKKLRRHFIQWKREAQQRASQGPDETSLDSRLSPQLAGAVSEALARDSEDIAELMKAALRYIGESRMWVLFPTVYENSTIPASVVPDMGIVRSLREVLRIQQEEILRVNHGLRSGKLDARRLYRAYTTGMTFKRKESFLDSKWSIVVLIDASSSMADSWGLIESVCASFIEGLRGEYNQLEVFAYREVNGSCVITNLLQNNHLYRVDSGGDTPSGQAIVATALKMRKRKRRLILHITDGFSNSGIEVGSALRICEREKIRVVALGCGSPVSLRENYGSRFELLDSIEQLPQKAGALLRKELLGSFCS